MEEFEEFDEDGLVDSDDDDNSWKVRRAALKARTAGTGHNQRLWTLDGLQIRPICSTHPPYPACGAALGGA